MVASTVGVESGGREGRGTGMVTDQSMWGLVPVSQLRLHDSASTVLHTCTQPPDQPPCTLYMDPSMTAPSDYPPPHPQCLLPSTPLYGLDLLRETGIRSTFVSPTCVFPLSAFGFSWLITVAVLPTARLVRPWNSSLVLVLPSSKLVRTSHREDGRDPRPESRDRRQTALWTAASAVLFVS